jgi:hypothetical protein
MTKPHEETWTTGEGARSGALYDEHGTWLGSFTRPERARLAKEAPRLAMMLLEHVESCPDCGGTGIQWIRATPPAGEHERAPVECTGCSDDRDVLKAAGVIP